MLADGPTVDIAHRQELVFQIAMALARDGIPHRILAPEVVSKFIIEKQYKEFGKNYVTPGAPHTVAGVDMLLARADTLGQWVDSVKLAQIDEGHHCLSDNKWGRALRLFRNALQIGWTATPTRSDRRSLHIDKGGIYDAMVLGPTPRELLAAGYLCPFKVYGPPASIARERVPVSAGGDFSPTKLREEAHRSTVCGDMLTHYDRLTPGLIGIGFLVDVAQAKETSERFNAEGWRTAWMSAKETDDRTRVRNIEMLSRGELQIIFNVGLLGEGVDVPRVEVVLDGAPTASLGNYLQRFGRLLRNSAGKERGVYLDLVGNVVAHGLPTLDREWSLEDGRPPKPIGDDEATLIKACPKCFEIFERFRKACPACGHVPEPKGRGRPEEVDGDLTEYSPELLAELRGEAARIMEPAPVGLTTPVRQSWELRAMAQNNLREALGYWGGVQQAAGRSDADAFRLFWHRFGVDVATAQTLGSKQAAELCEKIWANINEELK